MAVKNDILELETRRKIYQYILKNPGLHLRELSRRLKIPITTLRYHLRFLKKRDLINEQRGTRLIRYYGANKTSNNDKELLCLLRNKTIRQIILILYYNVVTSRVELSDMLEKKPNTISYYLKKLLDLGIIEPAEVRGDVVISAEGTIIERSPIGREVIYRFKNASLLWKPLISYQKSYLDDFTVKLFLDSITIHTIDGDKMPKVFIPLSSQIDRVINVAKDFFPIPFCA